MFYEEWKEQWEKDWKRVMGHAETCAASVRSIRLKDKLSDAEDQDCYRKSHVLCSAIRELAALTASAWPKPSWLSETLTRMAEEIRAGLQAEEEDRGPKRNR